MTLPLQADVNVTVSTGPSIQASLSNVLIGALLSVSPLVSVSADGSVNVNIPSSKEAFISVVQSGGVQVDVESQGNVVVDVAFGSSGSSSGGNPILWGSTVPSGSLGSVGDSYINITTGALYQKTGASTWTPRFQFPTEVANDYLAYICPDATTRYVQLLNSKP